MATKATLQQAAKVVTGNPKATLQEMADTIVKGGLPGGGNAGVTSLEKLEDYSSILKTSAEVSEEIGGMTVVLLDELFAISEIDARPSHKKAGATVYAENGAVGIISTIDTTNQVAEIVTLSSNLSSGVSVSSAPTTAPADFLIELPGNLVFMGGVANIGVMGPEVAVENTPVEFAVELADANFVPTLTVITGDGFQRIVTDVSNRLTTGFDICARNVGDETASGIQISWTVVGRKASEV